MTEPKIVVTHREHLWWLLAEAAQLEHMMHQAHQRAATITATIAAHVPADLRAAP